MKASIAHGIRPTALILGKDSKRPWGKWDILLAKAYQRFLNEICQQCGLPKYICHSEDNRIQFKLVEDECAATARSERAQEALVDAKKKSFGVKLYGEPYLMPEAVEAGLEFSDFRKPWLVETAKKRGLLPDEFPIPEP